MRSDGRIIEVDEFTEEIMVTVGIRVTESTTEIIWVSSNREKSASEPLFRKEENVSR